MLMDNALHRIPALDETGIRKFYNGPESFTPDNQFLMGEAPGVRGFFVGAGFNSVGIASAGGAGRALAEWVVEGEPTSDLVAVDIRRFAPFHAEPGWLRQRVVEILGLHYAVPWPNRELTSARPLRVSPVYDRLAARNACFGSKMGWERANFFAPPGEEPVLEYSWDKPRWLPWSAAEQTATRSAVAVFDQTSFSKYLVSGRDAEASLQWICSNDVAVPLGTVVYTGLLNGRGTYESDLTVTRVAEDEFLLVSSSATTERDQDWIRRNVPAGHDTVVADVTESYAVLGVMGPRSRDLLARVSDEPFDDAGFATSRMVRISGADVRASRITYVGELGWELYVETGSAAAVYDALMAGTDLGVVDAGYYAIESLRLEKGYRAFGRELTPDFGPVEAGLLFACKLRGDVDFLGRAAVEEARSRGPRRRLVSFVVDDPEPMLWGGELVLRDGVPVGQVTSAAWGETVGACVGLAYVADPAGGDDPGLGHGRGVQRERGRLGASGVRRPPRAVRPGQPPGPGRRAGAVTGLSMHEHLPFDEEATPPRVSTGDLPSAELVRDLVTEAYERYRTNTGGTVADYIPALATASPDLFGICVVGTRGRFFEVGDVDTRFSIQSVSKPFVFALVCETIGYEAARHRLGVNGTGIPVRLPDGRRAQRRADDEPARQRRGDRDHQPGPRGHAGRAVAAPA